MAVALRDVLTTFGRFLLVILVLAISLVIVTAIVQTFSLEESVLRTLIFESIPFLGLLAGTVLLVRFVPPSNTINAGLSLRHAGVLLGTGAAIGVAWIALALAIAAATGEASFFPERFELSSTLALTALATALNVSMQQVLTRGYLYGAIAWKFGVVTAVILTSLFFVALHPTAFVAGPLAAINLLTAGLIFGLARVVSGSLWFAAGMHFVWNFTSAVALGELSSYPTLDLVELSGDSFWVGGTYGIETGFAVTIANGVLLAGLAAWIALRKGRPVASPVSRSAGTPDAGQSS